MLNGLKHILFTQHCCHEIGLQHDAFGDRLQSERVRLASVLTNNSWSDQPSTCKQQCVNDSIRWSLVKKRISDGNNLHFAKCARSEHSNIL